MKDDRESEPKADQPRDTALPERQASRKKKGIGAPRRYNIAARVLFLTIGALTLWGLLFFAERMLEKFPETIKEALVSLIAVVFVTFSRIRLHASARDVNPGDEPDLPGRTDSRPLFWLDLNVNSGDEPDLPDRNPDKVKKRN